MKKVACSVDILGPDGELIVTIPAHEMEYFMVSSDIKGRSKKTVKLAAEQLMAEILTVCRKQLKESKKSRKKKK